MKAKLFTLFSVGLLSLMFVSCENDKTSFSSESELNGNWVCIDEGKNFGVVYTFNNSEISYYRYEGGFIGDDNYYYYESIGNDLANGMTFKFEFDKQTQTIYVSGMKAGSLTRIDKDKVIFKEDYKYLVDGTFQRVKGVKSKSKADNGDNNNNDDDNNTPNATNGALPGKFSVSATTQIQFSQGNLQYQASTKTWRFAEQQYYYVGSENEKISDSNAGWIDLFGWGTGNNPTLVGSYSDYDDYSTFTDWGVNKISNGGNKANQWRTLTNDEWEYLLNERANASSKKGHATVAGVHGYILLPDSWALPSELSFSGLPDNFGTNVYTTSDWFKMEKAGAVFLSAAGYRYGTGMYSLYFVGYQGSYWSATPFKKYDTYDDKYHAYDFFFDKDGGWMDPHGYRYYGRSVRLVH